MTTQPAEHGEQDKGEHGQFTIVVLGKPVAFKIVPSEILRVPSLAALQQTEGRSDLDNWKLVMESTGKTLSYDEKEGQAHIVNGTVLLLSPMEKSGGRNGHP